MHYLKNHWTKHGHICTHFIELPISNKDIKFKESRILFLIRWKTEPDVFLKSTCMELITQLQVYLALKGQSVLFTHWLDTVCQKWLISSLVISRQRSKLIDQSTILQLLPMIECLAHFFFFTCTMIDLTLWVKNEKYCQKGLVYIVYV